MRNTEAAFHWIVTILREQKIPYQITGGFAARVYGSKWPLADIDIEIRDRDFAKIVPFVKRVIQFGPKWYRDKHWNVLLITLKKYGQTIDLIGTETEKIFACQAKRWIRLSTALKKATCKSIYGELTPIIRKSDLIAYKMRLGRGVDMRDVDALNQ